METNESFNCIFPRISGQVDSVCLLTGRRATLKRFSCNKDSPVYIPNL